MHRKRIILYSLMMSQCIARQIPSLVFHHNEVMNVINRRDKLRVPDDMIECKGIMYMDKDHWRIWLGDMLITPDNNPSQLEIESVSPTCVTYRLSKQSQSHITYVNASPDQINL